LAHGLGLRSQDQGLRGHSHGLCRAAGHSPRGKIKWLASRVACCCATRGARFKSASYAC